MKCPVCDSENHIETSGLRTDEEREDWEEYPWVGLYFQDYELCSCASCGGKWINRFKVDYEETEIR